MDQAASPSFLAELHEKHKERQARIKAAAIIEPVPAPTVTPPPQEPVSAIIATQKPRTSFEIVLNELSAYFKVRKEDLLSHRRLNYIASHRQLLAYMMYWLTDYSSSQIGDRMDRDYTTINYAIKKIQSNLPIHRKDIEELEARIKPLLPTKRK